MATEQDVTQIAIAKAIATIAHSRQVDKAGELYIGHPQRVVARLGAAASPETIATAWLHDVLEDTDITRDDLRAAGITWRVIHWVELLTRQDGQSPEDYYEALKNGPVGAWRVKLADIEDNTDPSRLALLDDETIVRLTRKYAKARLLLGAVTEGAGDSHG